MGKNTIIISGGGICGLAAALAARQAGFAPVVIEKAARFEEIGAGLQLGPNAVRALQRLGAWSEVEPVTRSPGSIEMRRAGSGVMVRQQSLGPAFTTRFGAPYRVAHRADVHAALLQAVAMTSDITLICGDTIVDTAEAGNAVVVQTAQGRSLSGAYLIAADGVHSPTRQRLVPHSAPYAAGFDLHRILLPASPGKADVVGLWMGAGFHCAHYHVGRVPQLNVIWCTPSGTTPADQIRRMSPDLAALAQQSAAATVWSARIVRPLTRWVFGRTILLGDAAHATVPFLAQGAAMALEDAVWLLDQLAGGEGFDESDRLQRTTDLHAASLRQAKVYHASGSIGHLRDIVLRHMPDELFWNRLDWIYRHGDARPRKA